MSTISIPADTYFWSISGRYEDVKRICPEEDPNAPSGVALYANSTARREHISGTEVWLYYLESRIGDAELILSYLDRIILQKFVASLSSLPYAGCVRRVLVADGLNPDLEMALTIRGSLFPHQDATAHAFTFTSIEFSRAGSSSTAYSTGISSTTSQAGSQGDTGPSKTPSPAQLNQPASGRVNKAALVGGVVAGVVVLTGLLALLIFVRKRRRSEQSSTRSPTEPAAPSDWLQYAMHIRNAILPDGGARGLPFAPLSTQDTDEPAVIFDAASASPLLRSREALLADHGSQADDWGQLIWNDEKRERQVGIATDYTGSADSASGAQSASALGTASTANTSAGRPVRWEEPPPQYSR